MYDCVCHHSYKSLYIIVTLHVELMVLNRVEFTHCGQNHVILHACQVNVKTLCVQTEFWLL